MISKRTHFLNSKSKYLSIAIILTLIVSVKIYLGKSPYSKDVLIMYTANSPSGFSVSLKENVDLGYVDILVDKGSKLSTQSFIDNFSKVQKPTPLAPAINIRPATDTPILEKQISLNIKIKLAPNQPRDRMHILYHSRRPNGKSIIGVLAGDSFNIIENTLSFNINAFGNYQLVTLPTALSESLSLQSSVPVYKARNNRLFIINKNWIE